MKNIVVIGAGNIGSAIAWMLAATGDYRITVADRSADQLANVPAHERVDTEIVDITDRPALEALLKGKFAVLSAAPFHLTAGIAEAAVAVGTHYLDLTEDVESTRRVKALAETAETALIPQCGLAPGFISIVAADLAAKFDKLDSVRMRVGALPQYPSNALNYNLTWSTDGLINEYIEPCEAIVEGRLTAVPALEEREEFSLDGVTALPRVDIIMAHENMDGKLIEAAVAAGSKGIVVAGVGNGNMTQPALDALAVQAKKGIVCVRSSRVTTGRVGRNVEVNDDKLGLVASDALNPQKARVLLRLALLKQRTLADVQRLFREY